MILKDLVDITYNAEWIIICSNGFIIGSYSRVSSIPDRYLLCKVKKVNVLKYELEVEIEEDFPLW